MPAFTKFGIWDEDVKEVITDIYNASHLNNKAALTKWFYSKGAASFMQAEEILLSDAEKKCLEKFGHRPLITANEILGNKFQAFMQLLPKLLKYFAVKKDSPDEFKIQRTFFAFVTEAVHRQVDFYEMEANVRNELNECLDELTQKGFDLNKEEQMILVKEKYQNKNPELTQCITRHLKMHDEYIAYMKKQKVSSSALFQPQAEFASSSAMEWSPLVPRGHGIV